MSNSGLPIRPYIAHRDEVAAGEQSQPRTKRALNAGTQFTHEQINESTYQKKAENNGPIKGQIQRQQEIQKAKWVENPGLDGGEKWHAALYIWVPEGEMTLTDGFNPETAKGMKKCGQVMFYQ